MPNITFSFKLKVNPALLQKQKLYLIELANDLDKSRLHPQLNLIDGLVNMIDSMQDQMVDDGVWKFPEITEDRDPCNETSEDVMDYGDLTNLIRGILETLEGEELAEVYNTIRGKTEIEYVGDSLFKRVEDQ